MKAVIPVRDIVPNPFQARKRIPVKSVRALADEIQELGLWPGSLKGRMKDLAQRFPTGLAYAIALDRLAEVMKRDRGK